METATIALDAFKSFFAEKFIEDDREPIATFKIPGFGEDEFGLFAPKVEMYGQLVLLLLIQTVIQTTFGFFIYQLVVKNRGSYLAYFFGWCCIIPASMQAAFYVMDWLHIYNQVLKLSLSTVGTVVIYRCIEAMYGTSPPAVETSLGTYMANCTSLMHFYWDEKTCKRKPAETKEVLSTLFKLLLNMHLLSLFMSVELHYNYQPYPSDVQINQYSFGWELLSVGHIVNTYLLVHVAYYFLSLAFEGVKLSEELKGYAVQPVFRNPIWESRSYNDYWARRWNLVMHRNLKFGTYFPARKYFPKFVATLMTFLSSGILHEHAWRVVFHRYEGVENYGYRESWEQIASMKPTMFFMYNGLLMVGEEYWSKYTGFAKSWPSWLCAHLVILCVLPVSHLYTGDWAWGGTFGDIAIAIWHIRKL